MDFLSWLFDKDGFPARWDCGPAWQESPWLGWLHIISDLGVWSAYCAIPIVLWFFIFRRKDLPFRKIFLLFGAFIFACGTTHLMEAIIFWWPGYRLAGAIKLITAVVSWATVFALIRVIPGVLRMRSPEELEREIAARKLAELQLQRNNVELEQRVAERTAELTLTMAALRDERELLRTTLTSIGDAVISTDPESRVTFMNVVAEKLTAWPLADARGKPLLEVFNIINESSRKPVENPAVRALREGVIVGLANHTILLARDGAEYPIDDSAAPIRDSAGQTVGAVLVFRDITERKQAEAEIRQREQQFATLAESIPQLTWIANADGHIFWYNRRWYEYTGTTFEQMQGWGWQSVHDPQILPLVMQRWQLTLATGEPFDMVFPLRSAAGEFRPFLTRIVPFKNDEGKVIRWFGTNTDVADERRMAQELEQLAGELAAADRRKDEFLATLAHELRNPLAPIRNSLEVLKRADGDTGLIDASRETMERQMTQMVRLIDDLLDVSRITRNKLDLRTARVELASIVHHAIETCRPLIDEADLQFELSLPAAPIYLNADSIRLTQVFSNLLTNAAKYTKRGGKIWFVVEREGSDALITVTDTGVGIPPNMLPRVFEMFTQIERTRPLAQGGLGIGLTIVKRLVEMHNGSITVHSDGEGLGSRFTVRLPIMIETSVPVQHLTVSDPLPKISPRKILVVDDNIDAAKTLSLLLKLTGHQVQTAHDGQAALAMAEEFRPEVILLDIGMPVLNGYDTCRALREKPWGKDVLIIALTGWGQEDDRRKSTDAGFDGHLVKPVDHTELMRLLAKA